MARDMNHKDINQSGNNLQSEGGAPKSPTDPKPQQVTNTREKKNNTKQQEQNTENHGEGGTSKGGRGNEGGGHKRRAQAREKPGTEGAPREKHQEEEEGEEKGKKAEERKENRDKQGGSPKMRAKLPGRAANQVSRQSVRNIDRTG